MNLKRLSEVIWNAYQEGNPRSDKQTFSQSDVEQMCKTAAANSFRQMYMFGQRVIPGKKIQALPDEPEYYFLSPLLAVKRFKLSEPDELGKRTADMKEFDLYRLPKNMHFTNIYMVNGKCGGQKTNVLTLLRNGEEKFYAGKPKYKFFVFGTVVGRGIETFNVPACVKELDVETTFDSDNTDVDITLDIASDVLNEVLKLLLGTDEATGEQQVAIREKLKEEDEIK